MRVSLYIGDSKVYDSSSRYDNTSNTADALSIKANMAVNDAGTAEFELPYNNDYLRWNPLPTPYKTLIRIYRDKAGLEDEPLLFRGRVISIKDTLYGTKTFQCEGELAFLKDSVIRPRTISGTLYQIFAAILSAHNGQVEQFKQFLAGTVDVTTDDSSPSIEVTEAESSSSVMARLIDKYGGYIRFETDAETGYRVMTWHKNALSVCSQDITLGGNLLDYASVILNSDYANRIIPYGKRVNGTRITISSGGHDYVEDAAAQAVCGIVSKAVIFEDISTSSSLLARAQEYLSQSKQLIKTLSLRAIDMTSLFNTPQNTWEAIESWKVGQYVHVSIPPREINDDYLLTARTYNLLDPSKDLITLGGKPITLTSELYH